MSSLVGKLSHFPLPVLPYTTGELDGSDGSGLFLTIHRLYDILNSLTAESQFQQLIWQVNNYDRRKLIFLYNPRLCSYALLSLFQLRYALAGKCNV